MEVVAEGVETHAQLDFLRAVGCDAAQGYHLARPLPHARLHGVPAAGGARAGDVGDLPSRARALRLPQLAASAGPHGRQ